MNCRTAQKQIHLHIDGELALEHQAALADHLENCAACRTTQQQLASLVRGLGQFGEETAQRPSRVLQIERYRPRRWPMPTAAAAVIALLVIGGWVVHARTAQMKTTTLLVEQRPAPSHRQDAGATAPLASARSSDRGAVGAAVPLAIARAPGKLPPAAAGGSEPPRVQVRFAADSQMLAIPVETKNPNITILRIYPKLQMARSSETSGERGS